MVVFDSHMIKKSQKEEIFDNLKIFYTKKNQFADTYIE
jgi:predicted RNA-binding protein with PIN domain